ncbi:MAG TPA: hypothetical protein EYO33_27920 [Phycisphaerales bacterium]|nr:hypothetical protein [Phycisphaerales bacterium]
MPLPDANKRSPRVYTLLQNLDLENVTAANLSDVADTISIEEANEDELRRICLVAFARMVTKGSFDGWLSGGGGGMDQVGVLENATYKYFSITQAAPWGSLGPATGTDVINYDTPAYVPFVCPKDGAVAGLSVDLTSAGSANLYAGIYSSSDGLPDSLLGYATMDMNVSTGNVRQTSFSSTITLERGVTYWLAWVRSTYTSFTLSTTNDTTQASLGPTGDVENGYSMVMIESGTTHTLPATVTPANLQVTSEARIMCNLDW